MLTHNPIRRRISISRTLQLHCEVRLFSYCVVCLSSAKRLYSDICHYFLGIYNLTICLPFEKSYLSVSVCLSFHLSLSSDSVILYLHIYVVIWAPSLDDHLLFWQPVTVYYTVLLLFNLCYVVLANKVVDLLTDTEKYCKY